MPIYEEINPDTMDLLFGYLDFEKFKSTMLIAQKGMIDEKPNEEDSKK
jgi:hypothetical protein